MTTAPPRPRIVDLAFWSWIVSTALLVVGGVLSATTGFRIARGQVPDNITDEQLRTFLMFYRGLGWICVLLGVAIGYLAYRTYHGDRRFRRAAVALSLASVAVLGFCALLVVPPHPFALLAAVALLVAAGLVTRDSAIAWFGSMHPQEATGD